MVKVSWLKEFWILLGRSMYKNIYNPMILQFKTFVIIIIGLVCLSTFWNPGDDREGVRGTIGAMFFATALFTHAPIGTTTQTLISEKPVFLKEYLNKTYGLLSYAISKDVVEIPFDVFYVFLFSIITYFAIGLEATFEKFMTFFLAIVMNDICFMSLGLFLSSVFNNEESATLMEEVFAAP